MRGKNGSDCHGRVKHVVIRLNDNLMGFKIIENLFALFFAILAARFLRDCRRKHPNVFQPDGKNFKIALYFAFFCFFKAFRDFPGKFRRKQALGFRALRNGKTHFGNIVSEIIHGQIFCGLLKKRKAFFA